jgi:C1A family cysteine protease
MPRAVHSYGWVPDVPDHRDHKFAASAPLMRSIPPAVDLRSHCPAVYDQGQLGSCTANAIAGAIEFDQIKEKKTPFVPARLFIYYNERSMEGTIPSDSGAAIRDGVKSVATVGAPSESTWPYGIGQFAVRPPQAAFTAAALNKVISYQSVPRDLTQMRACLAAGFPFVYGFSVYDSFESQDVATSGHAPMPAPSEALLGGHAVLAVGYDNAHQWFICRNSWGPGWGMSGYFTLPYAYFMDPNLSDDFWTIRMV